MNPDHTVARLSVGLPGKGTDDASLDGLEHLRTELLPATLDRVPGVSADVTGPAAYTADFNALMRSRTPLVFAFVLGLAFVLMLVSFRSIVVPIKAIVLNLLSVGASYGMLKLVFQDGHGEGVLGFESNGGVTTYLPLFLFVILFGLSMDYHVFILSRVREAWSRGMSSDEAVAHGIKTTAGTVTSAAVIMVAVFAAMATGSTLDAKEMGVGLAFAVLIDATVIRGVLLPASMKLLGDRNWYLPRWLEWLPRLDLEGDGARPRGAREPGREPGPCPTLPRRRRLAANASGTTSSGPPPGGPLACRRRAASGRCRAHRRGEREEQAPDRAVQRARGARPRERAGEPGAQQRVAGQPREDQHGHRRHHRRRKHRTGAGRHELREQRRPEQPDLDVREVAREPAPPAGAAGPAGRRHERIAADGRAQRLRAQAGEIDRAAELERRVRGFRGGQRGREAEHRRDSPADVAGGGAECSGRAGPAPVGKRGPEHHERVGARDQHGDGGDGEKAHERFHDAYRPLPIASVPANFSALVHTEELN